MTSRSEVVEAARSWKGVRWRHQGRTRDGVDCIGLILKTLHALNLSHFDTVDYEREATDERMMELCDAHLTRTTVLRPADIVVMPFAHQRHIALIGDHPLPGRLTMIHAYLQNRKVVEHIMDADWAGRIVGRYSIPGVA